MASEVIDYEAVLADLEATKAALDSAIAGIRQMLSLAPPLLLAGTLKALRGNRSLAALIDTELAAYGDDQRDLLALAHRDFRKLVTLLRAAADALRS